jgi:iron complex outermembrane receptor protein
MFHSRLSALSSVSLFALAVLGMPTAAAAQDNPSPQDNAAQCGAIADAAQRELCLRDAATTQPIAQSGDAATLQGAAQPSDEGGIVVTGSRIRRSEFSSPDPIQVINPEVGLQQGLIETAEIINQSPLASGSIQITSVISNNFVTNGGGDAQSVSLRGLGAERTLVLLNGRRAGPAGVRGAVAAFDLNVLPVSIIQSVEILKAGASSIYGSDAVAGVVNILTRRNTDGLEVEMFGSMPFERGGDTYRFDLSYGRTFERGSFLITADYYRRQDLRRRDRDFLDCSEEYLTFVDGRRADIVDPRTGSPACNGTIGNLFLTNNDFSGPGFRPGLIGPNGQQLFVSQYAIGNELNGVCVPINGIRPGIVAPANFFGCNFDGPSTGALNQYSLLEQNSDVQSDLERFTLYGQGTYEITPSIEAFVELLYNKRRSHNDGFQQYGLFQFTGSSVLPGFFCDDTIFNCRPGDAGDPLNRDFAGNFLLRPLAITESDFETDIDYYRGVAGLRGDFGNLLSGWRWDLHGQYSRSEGTYTQDVIFQDALFSQELRTRSCVGLTTPVRGVPCIDIDFSDPRVLAGNLTDQERAFLFGEETGRTVFEQLSGELSITGNLFRLPAGDVGVAFGVQVRRDEIRDVPGEVTLAGNAALRTSSGITAGSTMTREVFGEIEIPLIHNTPLIRSFSITGAGRYSWVRAERRDGVTDSFSDATWRIAANWEVTNWLRFRGSWGTSFRAPALFELFLENQTGFQQQQNIDICINTQRALDLGTINQRIFDNCAADGIPPTFAGATGSATVTSGGGIGVLESETSTSRVASVILTPETRGFLWGGMQVSLILDYFDIEVEGEITQLGAANIVLGCYDSEFFPDEPLCDQITRAPAGTPAALNITAISDSFLNINRQRNRGIDATVRVVQDLGRLGTLSLLGQMTWQLEDTIELFEGTEVDDNGENGDPKWTGNFNLSWSRGSWNVLYGLAVTGGTSDLQDLIDTQGAPCRTSLFRPGVSPAAAAAGQRVQFCQDVRLSPYFLHSLSATKRFGDRVTATVGVANLFDTRPPRASTALSGINAIGQVPAFGSQYDYFGRRVFANVRVRF